MTSKDEIVWARYGRPDPSSNENLHRRFRTKPISSHDQKHENVIADTFARAIPDPGGDPAGLMMFGMLHELRLGAIAPVTGQQRMPVTP